MRLSVRGPTKPIRINPSSRPKTFSVKRTYTRTPTLRIAKKRNNKIVRTIARENPASVTSRTLTSLIFGLVKPLSLHIGSRKIFKSRHKAHHTYPALHCERGYQVTARSRDRVTKQDGNSSMEVSTLERGIVKCHLSKIVFL
jgi:hypothetical protein